MTTENGNDEFWSELRGKDYTDDDRREADMTLAKLEQLFDDIVEDRAYWRDLTGRTNATLNKLRVTADFWRREVEKFEAREQALRRETYRLTVENERLTNKLDRQAIEFEDMASELRDLEGQVRALQGKVMDVEPVDERVARRYRVEGVTKEAKLWPRGTKGGK